MLDGCYGKGMLIDDDVRRPIGSAAAQLHSCTAGLVGGFACD